MDPLKTAISKATCSWSVEWGVATPGRKAGRRGEQTSVGLHLHQYTVIRPQPESWASNIGVLYLNF